MKRWNGWGNTATIYPLADSARKYLIGIVGEGRSIKDAEKTDVMNSIPPGRLPDHSLINTSSEERLMHSRGQSLPDWVSMRHGISQVFTDGVAYPDNEQQVVELLRLAEKQHFSIIPFGGGSSVLGHVNPMGEVPSLTLDMGRMDRILYLDKISRTAKIQAGAAGPAIEADLNTSGYTLGHFPQSFEYSTLGGWVATRSVGQQSYRYGRIDEMLLGCEVETPAGTLTLPAIPASAAGPDLRHSILGSEGRPGSDHPRHRTCPPAARGGAFLFCLFPGLAKRRRCCQGNSSEQAGCIHAAPGRQR